MFRAFQNSIKQFISRKTIVSLSQSCAQSHKPFISSVNQRGIGCCAYPPVHRVTEPRFPFCSRFNRMANNPGMDEGIPGHGCRPMNILDVTTGLIDFITRDLKPSPFQLDHQNLPDLHEARINWTHLLNTGHLPRRVIVRQNHDIRTLLAVDKLHILSLEQLFCHRLKRCI